MELVKIASSQITPSGQLPDEFVLTIIQSDVDREIQSSADALTLAKSCAATMEELRRRGYEVRQQFRNGEWIYRAVRVGFIPKIPVSMIVFLKNGEGDVLALGPDKEQHPRYRGTGRNVARLLAEDGIRWEEIPEIKGQPEKSFLDETAFHRKANISLEFDSRSVEK